MTSARAAPRTKELKGAAEDVALEAAMYRIMVENTTDVIFRYSAARTRLYVSPASRDMLGYEPAELMGSDPGNLIHPDDFVRVHPDFAAFGKDKPELKQEFRMRRKDGRYIWIEAHHRYIPQDGTSVGVLRDITARKNAELLLAEMNQKLAAANDVLRRLSEQDGLTGLANRRRFDELLMEEFNRASRRKESLAVLLLDVDWFKPYNDRYGHLAGDDCLRRISRAIEAALRRPGDHVARYGGEEFVALLPATDLIGAILVGQILRGAVSALAIEHLGSPHLVATISIGASAVIPYGDDTAANLVEAADRALYLAKGGGRDQVRGSEASAFVAAG